MAIISVSLAFSPSADLLPEPSDLILGSADTIFFYVHTAQLLAASANLFNAHLPENKGQLSSSQPAIFVSEHASVLNILLHAIYKIPVAAYRPVLDDLISALTAMPKYGLDMKQYTAPGSELAELLLANAPLQLLDVYAMANKYGLADLAQRASPHLLSLHLTNVSNELAECMGAVALKKLFFLHLGRIDAVSGYHTLFVSFVLNYGLAQAPVIFPTASTRTDFRVRLHRTEEDYTRMGARMLISPLGCSTRSICWHD